MSDMADLKCTTCGGLLERVRFFPRQLLTAGDLCAEQDYHREKLRRHQRHLHGWGVVCGCSVEQSSAGTGWQVRVNPGYAVSAAGDEIDINAGVDVDLLLGAQAQPCVVQPCPPQGEQPSLQDGGRIAYVAVRHAECYSRPVHVHPAGCGCDETSCEYSRIRETFEIKVLWALPRSHEVAAQQDAQWRSALAKMGKDPGASVALPVPPCPECNTDPWVVLATIALPKMHASGGKDTGNDLQISYKDRRVLWSTQRLQTALPGGTE